MAKDFKLNAKTSLVCNNSQEGIYRPRSGVHRPSPPSVQADNHQRKETKQ
jgi:hypothetical protein